MEQDRPGFDQAQDSMIRHYQQGGDINEENMEDGTTPLITAAAAGHNKVANYLLAHGVDADRQNHEGHTALIVAAQHGYADVVLSLLNQGVDVNVQDNHGYTALMYASTNKHLDVVDHLLDNEAFVEIRK